MPSGSHLRLTLTRWTRRALCYTSVPYSLGVLLPQQHHRRFPIDVRTLALVLRLPLEPGAPLERRQPGSRAVLVAEQDMTVRLAAGLERDRCWKLILDLPWHHIGIRSLSAQQKMNADRTPQTGETTKGRVRLGLRLARTLLVVRRLSDGSRHFTALVHRHDDERHT